MKRPRPNYNEEMSEKTVVPGKFPVYHLYNLYLSNWF